MDDRVVVKPLVIVNVYVDLLQERVLQMMAFRLDLYSNLSFLDGPFCNPNLFAFVIGYDHDTVVRISSTEEVCRLATSWRHNEEPRRLATVSVPRHAFGVMCCVRLRVYSRTHRSTHRCWLSCRINNNPNHFNMGSA